MSIKNPINIAPDLAAQLASIVDELNALSTTVTGDTSTQILAARDYIVANLGSDTQSGQDTLVGLIETLVHDARDSNLSNLRTDIESAKTEILANSGGGDKPTDNSVIKSIQRGSRGTDGSYNMQVTISPVDINKSFLTVDGALSSGLTSTSIYAKGERGRQGFGWQVIEYV
jgi:hypothetical protein